MRRVLLASLGTLFLLAQGCASAQTVGMIGTTVPAAGVGVAPGAPIPLVPVDGATGVTVTPTLSCSATGATTYDIYFGTANPPPLVTASTPVCSYSPPASLPYVTVHYWKVCATNPYGTTCASSPAVWSFTTRTAPGPTSFVPNHPRLFLTASKLAECSAHRLANTAEWAAMKTEVDTYLPANAEHTTTLTSALGTGGAGTTFTVADGSMFPTGSTQYRLDLEVVTLTRSGNTFTVVSRANLAGGLGFTNTVAHASGATIWEGAPSGTYNANLVNAAMLMQCGQPGYAVKARSALSELMCVYGVDGIYTGDNQIRWLGFHVALGYDWNYANLTANEKSVYAALIKLSAEDHLNNPKEGIGYFHRQSYLEAAMGNNIAMSQVRGVLAFAAATYGDNADAQSWWDAEMTKVTAWMKPGMLTGGISGGLSVEGLDYGQTDWIQLAEIPQVIASAIGDATIVTDLKPWYRQMIKAAIYLTAPATTNSTTTTTATATLGSSSMTLASASTFGIGQDIAICNGSQVTAIAGISGTAVTLRDPALQNCANGQVQHLQLLLSIGDAEEPGFRNYHDYPITAFEPQTAMMAAQEVLEGSDPTLTSYAEYWLQNNAPHSVPGGSEWRVLLHRDPALSGTGVDYTAALATNFTTSDPDAMGGVWARSNWTGSASLMFLISGTEMYDHGTAYIGSYGYWRKGTYLTRHLSGYGLNGFAAPYPFINYPITDHYNEVPHVGAPYHNTVWMNGHGPQTYYTDLGSEAARDGPASLARSEVTSSYAYGRVDGSGMYHSGTGGWTDNGYANNDAQTFVRDWIAIPGSDLMAFNDRLVYANATTSPTKWFLQFAGNPSLSTQRISMSYGTSTLVQDVLLPTSASFTKVAMATDENSYLCCYRYEVTSGVSASTEYGFHVIQGGDTGFTPLAVTTLTTTNANVAEVGTAFVIGAVRGASPTLNITYVVSGTPRNLLMGFTPSTAYHVTRSVNTITIAPATGTGDTTATVGGILDFTL